jgi:molybdate transport system regulatory protein
MTSVSLDAVFSLRARTLARVGEDRIGLLRAVRQHRSISAAARACNLSYKAAWDAIGLMNDLFDRPLVAAIRGGRRGGGAELTCEGEKFVHAFDLVQRELARVLAALERAIGDDEPSTPVSSLRGIVLRTSARNALRCRVESVIDGPVSTRVVLDLSPDVRLVSVITARSARELTLGPGREVIALVKSSFVGVARDDGSETYSVENTLRGVIALRDDDDASAEVSIDLGAGLVLVAVVERVRADDLVLREGDRVIAHIEPSHILLAVDG